MAITEKKRKQCEDLIYTIMDIVDGSKANSDYYKEQFSKMTDNQFYNHFKNNKEFSLKFFIDTFNIEPKIEDIHKALHHIGVPTEESISMPYLYTDENGVPVDSQKCTIGYIHVKALAQMASKKNGMSTNIDQRDMKNGLLINADKNGKTSDKESEAMIIAGLDATHREHTTFRADNLNAKNIAYNIINATGDLSMKDIPIESTDSIAKNLLNVYLIGSMIKSNIISDSYVTPYYANNKGENKIIRN